MKKMTLTTAIAAAIATTALAADDMIGVRFTGDVYTLSSSTGQGSFLAASGAGALNGTAMDAAGRLYAANAAGELHRIDTTTGQATLLGSIGGDVRAMAIDSQNRLFAARDGGQPGPGLLNPDTLVRVDLVTLAVTTIGVTDLGGIQALAFDASDTLFAFDVGLTTASGTGLNTLDTTTGKAVDVNPSVGWGGSAASIQFLAFRDDGRLFGGGSSLFELDPAAGTWTLVGAGGYADLRGADFLGADPGCVATWSTYGAGAPGSLGEPKIKLDAHPVLGTTPNLVVSSSSSAAETSILVFGLGQASIPGSWGGALLVNPAVTLSLPLPPSGWSLPLPIPDDAALCGLKIYFQMIQSDGGAPFGASSTQGIAARLGT